MPSPPFRRIPLAILVVILGACGLGWFLWKHHQKAEAGRVGQEFAVAVMSADSDVVERHLLAPSVFSEKSPLERRQLTLELLSGEVSPEGVAIITRDGRFGPLHEIFPEEADAWATASSVKVEECVAFRLDRGEYRAELVLHLQPDSTYRILRCNDIRQLALQP